MKKSLGNKGEEAAVGFLKKRGYKILMRNYRAPSGEIDIIAMDGKTLVFAEVKTRASLLFGHPSEAVDQRKMHKIERAASHYISTRKADARARFDVISVSIGPDGEADVEHIKDAFELGSR